MDIHLPAILVFITGVQAFDPYPYPPPHSIGPSPQHVLVQSALGHPLDPREERQVLARRQGADERVELGAVADQTAHLTWRIVAEILQIPQAKHKKNPGET